MASIKEVALRAGVSISTVSNVLNETKYVSEPLKKRVHIAVKELGYVPDPVASSMITKMTKTIGLITPDICGLFYPYIVKEIYDVANKKGYNVILYDTSGTTDKKSKFEKEKESFEALVRNKVDGIIFFSMVTEEKETSYVKEIKKMISGKRKIAIVSIERDFSKYGIGSVFSDTIEGAKKATNHLIDQNCKRIGHIAGDISSKVAQDRIKGYKTAMEKQGLDVDDRTMIVYGDYSHQQGYEKMMELINSMPNIDGVYIANDQMAIGACRALKELGKRIPYDIKVIGYDNVFVSSMVEPPLSTIHIRKKHMGYEASRLLFKQIEGKIENDNGIVKLMDTRLVVRKSTDPNAPEDWILTEW